MEPRQHLLLPYLVRLEEPYQPDVEFDHADERGSAVRQRQNQPLG